MVRRRLRGDPAGCGLRVVAAPAVRHNHTPGSALSDHHTRSRVIGFFRCHLAGPHSEGPAGGGRLRNSLLVVVGQAGSPRPPRLGWARSEQGGRLAIRLYFRLSEDQADLRAQSWVSDDTWREWKGAIHSQMSRSPFNRLWDETRQNSDEGRDYSFQHLREICRNADYDPRPKSRWRRLRHRA